LTDGGVVQNCPVIVLLDRPDVSEVLCVSLSSPGDSEATGRITGFVDVMKSILNGMVLRNEFTSYMLGHNKWGEKFRVVNCQVGKDINIFDTDQIPYVMQEAKEKSKFIDPESMTSWIPKKTSMKCGNFDKSVEAAMIRQRLHNYESV
jgi:hypothetical protein